MIRNILISILAFWFYRQIGVLRYKIKSARSDYEKTGVDFPNPPNLLTYLFFKYVIRYRLRWLWPYQHNFWKFDKYTLKAYKEIYFWPWLEIMFFYTDRKFRILELVHSYLRTYSKKALKNSYFRELAEKVNQELPGFKIIALRESGTGSGGKNKKEIFLKLPHKTIEFLGPWTEDKENPHNWDLISKFQPTATECLNATLRLPSLSDKNIKTKEVITIVYSGTFCGNPSWGDFQVEKWEAWKKSFINFFQEIAIRKAI